MMILKRIFLPTGSLGVQYCLRRGVNFAFCPLQTRMRPYQHGDLRVHIPNALPGKGLIKGILMDNNRLD